MKRGVLIHFTILFILFLLVVLPFLVMFITGLAAEGLGCEMSGGSMPGGTCGTLYAILTVVGWSSIALVPIMGGIFLLYLAGSFLFGLASFLTAGLRGQPVSPVAKGIVMSTLVLVLLGGGGGGLLWLVYGAQVDLVDRCENLPGALAPTGKQNGLLALSVAIRPEGGLEERAILVVTPDGNLVTRLDPSVWALEPSWAPDGSRLAAAIQDVSTRRFDLRLLDVQMEPGEPLVTGEVRLEDISWTPDGQALLYTGLVDGGNPELFFVQVDGSGRRQVVGETGFDGDAEISPDGSQILFVSTRNGNDDIYVMDIDGTNVRRLTRNPALDVNPAWSPDGQWIVFSSTRGSGMAMNNYDVYIMVADGSSQCQLTQGQDTEWEPAWSPDGQWIVYLSLLERKAYMVRPDGTGTQPLPLPMEVDDIYYVDWAVSQ